MNLFLAACQGAGLAMAAGAFAGASGRRGTLGNLLLVASLIGGAALFGISLAAEDHPAWPGWPLGAAFAAFAFVIVRNFTEGAAKRAEGGGFVSAVVAFCALVEAALAVLLSVIAILAFAGLVWLASGQRRRATRKHEGLRTLR